MAYNGCIFCIILLNSVAYRAIYITVVEVRPTLSATETYPSESGFQQCVICGDILRDYWETVAVWRNSSTLVSINKV